LLTFIGYDAIKHSSLLCNIQYQGDLGLLDPSLFICLQTKSR